MGGTVDATAELLGSGLGSPLGRMTGGWRGAAIAALTALLASPTGRSRAADLGLGDAIGGYSAAFGQETEQVARRAMATRLPGEGDELDDDVTWRL